MAIRKFKSSSIAVGSRTSRGVDKGVFFGGFNTIASVTLTSASSTISFTSIPSNYKHLRIHMMGRSTGASDAYGKLTFNGSTSGYYALHQLYGTGSSISCNAPDASTSYLQTGYFTLSGAASQNYAPMILEVLDYASTDKFKTVRNFSGYDVNSSSSFVLLRTALWKSTSAINQIDLTVNGGNYATNTVVTLYGME